MSEVVAADWIEGATLALETQPYSDGRLWNGAMVAAEIHGYLETGLRAMIEVGRRLCWAKQALGHGKFLRWLESDVRLIGERSARQYMQVADFFLLHPKLLESCAGLGLKKALLLAQLPDEMVNDATNLGVVADIPLEQLGKLSYPDLERQLRAAKKDLETATKDRQLAEQLAERKTQQVDDLVASIHSTDDDELLVRIRKMRKTYDDAMALLTMGLDSMVSRASEGTLSPRVQAETSALVEYMSTWSEYEALRFRQAMGGDVYAIQLEDALSRPRPLSSRYVIPEDRLQDGFEAGTEPADAHVRPGGREPKLTVVRAADVSTVLAAAPATTPAATPAPANNATSPRESLSSDEDGLLSIDEAEQIAIKLSCGTLFVQKAIGYWAQGVTPPQIIERMRTWCRRHPDLAKSAAEDPARAVRQVLIAAGQDPDAWVSP